MPYNVPQLFCNVCMCVAQLALNGASREPNYTLRRMQTVALLTFSKLGVLHVGKQRFLDSSHYRRSGLANIPGGAVSCKLSAA